MGGEAGEAEEEADNEIRARCASKVHSDRADESRHAKRAENDTHGSAENTDEEREADASPEPQPNLRTRLHRPPGNVDAAPDEDDGNQGVEQRVGNVVRDESARNSAGDGRKRDPRDDAPVDPALTRVPQTARTRGGRGDRDVRPRGGERTPGRKDDERQAKRPEDEAEHRT